MMSLSLLPPLNMIPLLIKEYSSVITHNEVEINVSVTIAETIGQDSAPFRPELVVD